MESSSWKWGVLDSSLKGTVQCSKFLGYWPLFLASSFPFDSSQYPFLLPTYWSNLLWSQELEWENDPLRAVQVTETKVGKRQGSYSKGDVVRGEEGEHLELERGREGEGERGREGERERESSWPTWTAMRHVDYRDCSFQNACCEDRNATASIQAPWPYFSLSKHSINNRKIFPYLPSQNRFLKANVNILDRRLDGGKSPAKPPQPVTILKDNRSHHEALQIASIAQCLAPLLNLCRWLAAGRL